MLMKSLFTILSHNGQLGPGMGEFIDKFIVTRLILSDVRIFQKNGIKSKKTWYPDCLIHPSISNQGI